MTTMQPVEISRPSPGPEVPEVRSVGRSEATFRGDPLDEHLRLANLVRLSHAFRQAVVHELRGPLNAISLRLDLLNRSLEEDDPTDPAARRLQRDAVERVRAVLAEFSQAMPEAVSIEGLDPVSSRPFDLVALVRGVLSAVRHEALVRRLRIESELPEQPVLILADPARIRQAVLNLVSNAFDAMPSGGPVRISAGVRAGQARVRVEDAGPGIRPEHQAILSEGHPAPGKETAGIGLYVTRRILEDFGGTVRIDNRIDGGAIAEVEIPAATSRTEDAAHPAR
jgi:signal transduction histidine kinase